MSLSGLKAGQAIGPEGQMDGPPDGGLCIGAACPLTLLFTTATSDVCFGLTR